MRRWAIIIVLICYAVTYQAYSGQMFSFEHGKAYTENYNINHILEFSNPGNGQTPAQYNNSFAPSKRCDHFHVLLSCDRAQDTADSASHHINTTIPVLLSLSFQSNNYVSAMINSLALHTKLKILLPRHFSLIKSVFLRI